MSWLRWIEHQHYSNNRPTIFILRTRLVFYQLIGCVI